MNKHLGQMDGLDSALSPLPGGLGFGVASGFVLPLENRAHGLLLTIVMYPFVMGHGTDNRLATVLDLAPDDLLGLSTIFLQRVQLCQEWPAEPRHAALMDFADLATVRVNRLHRKRRYGMVRGRHLADQHGLNSMLRLHLQRACRDKMKEIDSLLAEGARPDLHKHVGGFIYLHAK